MKSFLIFFVFSLLLFCANRVALGQAKTLDSLQNRLKITTSDTAKINLMNKINSILVRTDYKLAVQKTKETIVLSQKNDYLWGEMIASRILGLAYSELREKDRI